MAVEIVKSLRAKIRSYPHSIPAQFQQVLPMVSVDESGAVLNLKGSSVYCPDSSGGLTSLPTPPPPTPHSLASI